MPKSLSTFLEDCRREIPNEVVNVTKTIDPAHYDATAILKHLGAQKKFPIAVFEQPLNLHGKVSAFKLVLNCEISQRKTQIALNFPRTLTRGEWPRRVWRARRSGSRRLSSMRKMHR